MTDWIIAVTTIVYAVLTSLVCVFNYRSSKAAMEQSREMKREYEDALRIKMMPFFSVQKNRHLNNIRGTINIRIGDFSDIACLCNGNTSDSSFLAGEYI